MLSCLWSPRWRECTIRNDLKPTNSKCLTMKTQRYFLLSYLPLLNLNIRCSHCILILLFWCLNNAYIFLIIAPKFQLQIHYILEVLAEKCRPTCTYFRYTNLIFLFIFITASSPVGHTYFCPRRENRKQHWGKILQNVSKGSRWISCKWKIHM